MLALNSLKIVDVTLRDGGYRNNFNFELPVIKEIVQTLSKSKIDYIEIGYKKLRTEKQNLLGITANLTSDVIRELQESLANHVKLSVMIHPKNINLQNLEELKKLGITMIRTCLCFSDLSQNIDIINAASNLGFITTANITRITCLEPQKIRNIVATLDKSNVDVIYIADSNGNMIPEQVTEIIKKIKNHTSKHIGFHAHNNLSFALCNSLYALRAGAQYIDASVCGMGKGAGNLALEVLLSYLVRIKKTNKYDLINILLLAEFLSISVKESLLPLMGYDTLTGALNLSLDFYNVIKEISSLKKFCIYKMTHLIGKENLNTIDTNYIKYIIYEKYKLYT